MIRKLAMWISGQVGVLVISILIDDLLWFVVVWRKGALVGGVIMFFIALLVNLVMIWAYDKIKKDLLSFETLNNLLEQGQKKYSERMLARLIKAGRVFAFVALSFYDPFLSVIYMRNGVGKYTMEKRDWGYFFVAMALSCTGWTLFWQGVIVVAKAII